MELSSHDVIYEFKIDDLEIKEDKFNVPEYKREVYKKIKTALEIDKEGYNVYLVDDFSKMKLKNIKKYIEEFYIEKSKPQDICYVIKEDAEKPYPIFLSGGKGYILKKTVEDLQKKYLNSIYNFYNGACIEEKDEIIDSIQVERHKLVSELMESAKEKGFKIKSTEGGFTFVPIKSNSIMTEMEYDELEENEKKNILSKVSKLKIQSSKILDDLKEIEIKGIEKIKYIMKDYFKSELQDIKFKYKEEFSEDMEAINFLNEFCDEVEKDVCDAYSMIYENDEETIAEIIMRYDVNVLVDKDRKSVV